MTRTPDELRLVMIDPKMVELTGYNGVPHVQCPVITEMDKVVGALRLVVQEMQRRYDVFSKAGVRNLDGYRMKIEDEPNAEKIPYLVVIVDELADLMLMAPAEVEALLQMLQCLIIFGNNNKTRGVLIQPVDNARAHGEVDTFYVGAVIEDGVDKRACFITN